MITIAATYRANEADADMVARLLEGYIAPTRAEPGCVTFVAHRSTEDPTLFLLYEQYADERAFEEHTQSEHYLTVARDQIRPLLAERKVDFFDVLAPD